MNFRSLILGIVLQLGILVSLSGCNEEQNLPIENESFINFDTSSSAEINEGSNVQSESPPETAHESNAPMHFDTDPSESCYDSSLSQMTKYRSLLREPKQYLGDRYLLKGQVFTGFVGAKKVIIATDGPSHNRISVLIESCPSCNFVEDDLVQIDAVYKGNFYDSEGQDTIPVFEATCGKVLN
jgi:hypothetical protein